MRAVFAFISAIDARDLALGCGAVAAALVAIAAALKVPFVSAPLRFVDRGISWVFRRLIGEPLAAAATKWFHGAMDAWAAEKLEPRFKAIEGEFRNNGGSTMRDRVDATARAVGAPPAPVAPIAPPPIDAE